MFLGKFKTSENGLVMLFFEDWILSKTAFWENNLFLGNYFIFLGSFWDYQKCRMEV